MALPKTFTGGERLFAADLNSNFEDLDTRLSGIDTDDVAEGSVSRYVKRFADASARSTAIPSPAEGMVSYLDDLNAVQVYDGSAWGQVGGLVAVKHALFTGTQTNSTAGGANFSVTDLTITHTLADAANKLVLMAYFGNAANSAGRGDVGIAIADDGTLIGIGDASGSRARVTAGGVIAGPGSDTSTRFVTMPHIHLVHTPGDTASHTYTVRAININTLTNTVYVNRSERDNDAVSEPRGVSALTLMEVKV